MQNVARVKAFRKFIRTHLKLSGGPIFRRVGLKSLAARYDVAFTGSDEVWKVDHMRRLDGSFYLDFCDSEKTHTASYAASASTVTDLRRYADEVRPLLQRLKGLGVRDPATAEMVTDLTGRETIEVLDPTLIWDFAKEDLPPIRDRPYLALYAWLDRETFAPVRDYAERHGLEIVSVGCRNEGSAENIIGIGPTEWLRLMKHSSAVVTDFFHGIVFALIFERPFYAFVDAKKRMKLQHVLDIVGLGSHLHETTSELRGTEAAAITPDWSVVRERLAPRREISRGYVMDQLAAAAKP